MRLILSLIVPLLSLSCASRNGQMVTSLELSRDNAALQADSEVRAAQRAAEWKKTLEELEKRNKHAGINGSVMTDQEYSERRAREAASLQAHHDGMARALSGPSG